ncbi:MAG TPA: HAMP domain-containing sensor histidine kinase [Kofleriaceae bacterium]|nr:HAMP domain-containing sensor histidine kinase [Kofleriaceae bacterium]
MRRLLLVNALIFAVLAAAVALAYYAYTYTAEVASRQSESEVLKELAEEKVSNVEFKVAADDEALLKAVRIDELDKLGEQMRGAAEQVTSVFVLDAHLQVVPGGSTSLRDADPKEAIERRDWYLANVIPKLGLQKLQPNQRKHVYGRRDDRPFLLAFMHKQLGDRTYYVVVEDDVNRLVGGELFHEVFDLSNHKRLYQVVDERGQFAYGVMFPLRGLLVRVNFDTLDGWAVRVTEEDDPALDDELHRKHIVDSVLIGGAVTIILAGLAFLALAIRRERRANELKSDFISNVSHELKTPLSIITMFGEMLANGRTKSSEQATEYAEIIYRESVRLDRLIENVLDFAKIERGMGVYEFADAELGEVVTRAIDLAARRLQTAEMTIDVEIAPELPIIKLDANALTLAVLNLIDNAIKYAAAGKKIAVKLAKDDHRVVLSVKDWGPGIERDEQVRIFERFYRAKAMRLKPIRGSGIGLALVQHIARAHGGDVSVTSTPPDGSTFQLWLPI